MIIAFQEALLNKLSIAREREELCGTCDVVEREMANTLKFLKDAATKQPEYIETAARDLAYSLARLYIG